MSEETVDKGNKESVHFRVNAQLKAAWTEAAYRRRMPLSRFIELCCREKIDREGIIPAEAQ